MPSSPHTTLQEQDIRLPSDLGNGPFSSHTASGAQRPRNNELSDTVLKELIERIPKPKGMIFHPPPPPPPPPLLTVVPPASEDKDHHGPAFKNSTKEPFKPTMHVNERLWAQIGGHHIKTDEEKRPIGKTAALAAQYLRLRRGDDDPTILGSSNEVGALLKEVKKVAEDCLGRLDDTNRDRFAPQTVRELQLVTYIGGKIRVELDGDWWHGILQGFSEPTGPFSPLDKYMLEIYLEHSRDGLSVIQCQISQERCFQGPAEAEFLSLFAGDSRPSCEDAGVLEEDGVMVDRKG